jgi:hypothetical protein
MVEYKVRVVERDAPSELEDVCNRLAVDGWRLVSTSVLDLGALRTRSYLFFEREIGEREPQDAWRTQHSGRRDAD